MSVKGGSYARFQRALATADPLIALAAAQELPRLDLADALALTCVLRTDARHFQPAAIRWHGRFTREVKGVSIADAHLALAALGSMPTSFEAAVAALTAVCERYGRGDLAGVLDATPGGA